MEKVVNGKMTKERKWLKQKSGEKFMCRYNSLKYF